MHRSQTQWTSVGGASVLAGLGHAVQVQGGKVSGSDL